LGNFDNARIRRMIDVVIPIFTAHRQPAEAGLKPEDIATQRVRGHEHRRRGMTP
jgi:hypothetical protein